MTVRFAVSGAEPDDHEAVPRARRRGEGVRAGAQLGRLGADAVPREAALSGGDTSDQLHRGQSVPEGAHSRRGVRAEQTQVTPTRRRDVYLLLILFVVLKMCIILVGMIL